MPFVTCGFFETSMRNDTVDSALSGLRLQNSQRLGRRWHSFGSVGVPQLWPDFSPDGRRRWPATVGPARRRRASVQWPSARRSRSPRRPSRCASASVTSSPSGPGERLEQRQVDLVPVGAGRGGARRQHDAGREQAFPPQREAVDRRRRLESPGRRAAAPAVDRAGELERVPLRRRVRRAGRRARWQTHTCCCGSRAPRPTSRDRTRCVASSQGPARSGRSSRGRPIARSIAGSACRRA